MDDMPLSRADEARVQLESLWHGWLAVVHCLHAKDTTRVREAKATLSTLAAMHDKACDPKTQDEEVFRLCREATALDLAQTRLL